MAAAPGPKKPIPRATGWQIPGALAKNVVFDLGILYTVADVFLFMGTNPLGFMAMLGAVGVSAAVKAACVLQPDFVERRPKLKKIIEDDRTPLRAAGLAMLLVTGATLATGLLLPAAASFFFAVSNFGLAETMSKKHIDDERHKAEEHKKQSSKSLFSTLFKRPDMYLNIGFGLAGLMAGGGAMLVLPMVAAAFGVGVLNTMRGKAEYEGHPKLITGAAAILFGAVGVLSGHPLIAVGHFINGVVLCEMERRMTPGGLPTICKNIASGAKKLLGKGKEAPLPAPQPAPAPTVIIAPTEEHYGHLPQPEPLRGEFGIRAQPVPHEYSQPDAMEMDEARKRIAGFNNPRPKPLAA